MKISQSFLGIWVRMGRNFDDYPGFQSKFTHPKHFWPQCMWRFQKLFGSIMWHFLAISKIIWLHYVALRWHRSHSFIDVKVKGPEKLSWDFLCWLLYALSWHQHNANTLHLLVFLKIWLRFYKCLLSVLHFLFFFYEIFPPLQFFIYTNEFKMPRFFTYIIHIIEKKKSQLHVYCNLTPITKVRVNRNVFRSKQLEQCLSTNSFPFLKVIVKIGLKIRES